MDYEGRAILAGRADSLPPNGACAHAPGIPLRAAPFRVAGRRVPNSIALTGFDRSPKDVRVHAVVIPEFKFSHIEREILAGNLVIGAHDSPFDDRPEAFNGVGVNRAIDVFAARVTHDAMTAKFPHIQIAAMFVCGNQPDLVGNYFVNKAV